MIIEKAIKTIILDYCIGIVFERLSRNFKTIKITDVSMSTFVFLHYSRFKRFIRVRRLDFAFHNFIEYLSVNSIQLPSEETMEIYVHFWDIHEEEKLWARATELALLGSDANIL